MPQRPSALGALRQRPYLPPPPPTYDFDAMVEEAFNPAEPSIDDVLRSSRQTLDEAQPEVQRINQYLAEQDAIALSAEAMDEERRRLAPPKVGVFGALATSAAPLTRVLTGFLPGPQAAAGEAVASGLEGLAHLDGEPIDPRSSMLRDTTGLAARMGTAYAFGQLGTKIGPLSSLARRVGGSLAAKLGGTTAGDIGAAGINAALQGTTGAIEGAGLNVAQGGIIRAAESGDWREAFDAEAAKFDATLGGGLGAAGGAAVGALDALSARASRQAGERAAAIRAQSNALRAKRQTPEWEAGDLERWQATPWTATDLQRFEDTGNKPWEGRTPPPPPPGPNVRGPSARQRVAPTGTPPQTPPGAYPPNMPAPPTAEELGATRLPAGSPEAAAAEPYVMPENTEGNVRDRSEFYNAMEEVEARPGAPGLPGPTPGPDVIAPFDMPIPRGQRLSLPQYGTFDRVAFDGTNFTLYQGGQAQMTLPPDRFAAIFPDFAGTLPRRPGEMIPPALPEGPSFADDPDQVAALEALQAERSSQQARESIDTDYDPYAEGDLEQLLGLTPEGTTDTGPTIPGLGRPPAPGAPVAPPLPPGPDTGPTIPGLGRPPARPDVPPAPEVPTVPEAPPAAPPAAGTPWGTVGEPAAGQPAAPGRPWGAAPGEPRRRPRPAPTGTPWGAVARETSPAAAGARELEDILLPPGDTTPVTPTPTPAPEGTPAPAGTPAPEAPAAAAGEGATQTLGEGDIVGTVNQAGKFVPITDESWRTHVPAKNKSVVIRRADGSVEVVTANGGKVSKTWDKTAWEAKQAQEKAKADAKPETPPTTTAAPEAPPTTPTAAAGSTVTPGAGTPSPAPASPSAVAADWEAPDSAFTRRGTRRTRKADGTLSETPTVEHAFNTKPVQSIRKALKDYGFNLWTPVQKVKGVKEQPVWYFELADKGSSAEEVEADLARILRGESPEGAAPAGTPAPAAAEGFPPPGQTEILDRGLTAEQKAALKAAGWTMAPVNGRRRWTKAGAAASATGGPGVPPTTPNPPQGGPSTPSEPVASGDEIRISADKIKVDAKQYQFKTGGDERGRLPKLKGVKGWRELTGKANRVILHKRLDGSYYVVDGHQRVGLAQDLLAQGKPVPDLYAVVLDEAAGVTVADARREGAMENLLGGTTEPSDIARVLRSGPLTEAEQAQIAATQSESGERYRQGRDLAALEDGAWQYYLDIGAEDGLDAKYARLVSQYKGEELQTALLRALERNNPSSRSEAKSILAKAADLEVTAQQPGLPDMPVVSDVDIEALTKFEQKVLGIFKRNRRLFGTGEAQATTFESAGATKIDREAMAKLGSAAERAEYLFDKFVNAKGSQTQRAIKEAFDEVSAGRLSLGKASERIAEALEADLRGGPPSGPSGAGATGEGPGGEGGGDGDAGWKDEDTLNLFSKAEGNTPGGLFDPRAVAEGKSAAEAFDDVIDDMLAGLKKKWGSERGSIPLTPGEGAKGLEELFTKNPKVFMGMMRVGGGAFLGALTHDEDTDATALDNILFGAVAGGLAPRLAGPAWRVLRKDAPKVAKWMQEALTGRITPMLGTLGEKAAPGLIVRKPPDVSKDISGIDKWLWAPDKVVPDVWKRIDPVVKSLYKLDAPQRQMTLDQIAVSRATQIAEAKGYLLEALTGAKDSGHHRRAAYVQALIDDLVSKPTHFEKFLSDVSGDKVTPKMARRGLGWATNAIYHSLLGWNVGAGVANMTQAAFNYAHLGAGPTAKGILKAYSKAGRQELAFLDLNRGAIGKADELGFHKWVEKYLEYSQTPIRWSDAANRRATYAGALEYAKQIPNISETQAAAFADELIGVTQGIAGDLGSNPFHRQLGPLRVFSKYPLIWASMVQDFATHPDPAVKRRFLGLMTGVFAASSIAGVSLTNFFIPRSGLLPGIGAAADVGEHAFGSPDHDLEEHAEPFGTEDRIVPGYINKVNQSLGRFRAHGLEDRNVIGRKGQVLRTVGAGEDLLSLLGIETQNRKEARTEQSEAYDTAEALKREESVRSRRIRRRLGEAMESGDRTEVRSALEALTKRQRSEFLRDRTRTPIERARRMTPTRRRDEFDQRFGTRP